MEIAKWISFMVILMSATGQDEFSNPDVQNYQYTYFVKDENTGDVKSHEERKLGDTVTGEYRVGEPTGDLRVVTYTADEGGFRANVKYEEGGSPLSDIRDKERQINPVSGYQFQWLPANPDDIEAAVKTDSEESSEPSNEVSESTSESTSEATSTEGTSSAGSSDGTTPGESSEENAESDSSDKSDDSSEEKPQADSPEDKPDESESKAEDDLTGEKKEESPDVAESAPALQEAAPTEPNQVYLPPNLPFYTPPAPDSQDSPTIIYASQNFYNPWQWFGTTARVQREQPTPPQPQGHYMTGLGYIIVPPTSEK